jgi:tRNA G18 (ribose-2'-O)-methylase SpoU
MRSNVNLSRIVRVAGCCGVERVVACGNIKPDPKITRDAIGQVTIDFRRTLSPAVKTLKSQGYRLVGLEQADNSQNLHCFSFPRRCVLVIGHERLGLAEELLELMDDVVEIPVYGMPFSYNAATAATMAMYEYCRQYPEG